MTTKQRRQRPAAARAILWPRDIEDQLAISTPTRWRWERSGKLPPRDAHVGGKAVGWRPSTIEAMLSGDRAQVA